MSGGGVHDVLVVGGGPAGAACAAALARHGLSVLVLERARFPREKTCGCCLHPRAWRLLEDLGAADAVRAAPHLQVHSVRILSWAGGAVRASLPAGDRDGLIAVRRAVLDTVLLEHARRLGATVLEETRALGVIPGNPLQVTARSPEGVNRLECRYLVGADGRNSTVAAKGPRGGRVSPRGRLGIQWFARRQPALAADVLLAILPFGYFGVVNIDKETANVAAALDPLRAPGDSHRLTHLLRETVQGIPALHDVVGDLSPRSQPLTTSPVTPRSAGTDHPRIILAGDAARTVEPFTGEGMALALQGGLAAASTILRAEGLDGSGRPPRKVAYMGSAITSLLLRHPPLAAAALRPLGLSPAMVSLALRALYR